MDERLAAQLELAALSNDDFVERAFRFLLRRPPDDEARTHALAALSEHGLSRAGLLAELAESEEFRRLRALDDGIGRGFAYATHPAWWIVAALGLAVAALGYLTTTGWARATARRTAERLEERKLRDLEPRERSVGAHIALKITT